MTSQMSTDFDKMSIVNGAPTNATDVPTEPEAPATVISSEGVEIPTTVKAVMQANFMRTMYADLGEEAAGVPIPWDVREPIARLTLAWCEHHRNDKTIDATGLDIPQHQETVKIGHLPLWDKEFLAGVNWDDLQALCNAADYLEIPDLMSYTAVAIAERVKGKSTQEMREMLGIENDWAPGEEEKIRKQNAWAMDC
ncbi:Skp1 family, dimerization domain-containing protein [Xylariaceae sp. FL1019]|nr:Skp1 family, dimerization domain-containing protein [Xylariaceae sp. FL1019]